MWAVFENFLLAVPIMVFILVAKYCSLKNENAGKQQPNFIGLYHFFQYGASYHSFVRVFVILQMLTYNKVQSCYDLHSFRYVYMGQYRII